MAKVDVESTTLVVAHAKDEGFETPVVHGELALEPGPEGISAVLTLRTVGAGQDDFPALERARKLKALIVRTMLPGMSLKVRWDESGPATDPPRDHDYEPHDVPRGIQTAPRVRRAKRVGIRPFSPPEDV